VSKIANKIQEGIGLGKQEHVIIRSPVMATFTQEHSEIRSPCGFTEGIKTQFGFSVWYEIVRTIGVDGREGDMATRQIIESLFGEFRAPIMKIYESLSRYDVQQATQGLADLERLMFTGSVEVQS
jgi:hypothetical protein